MTPEFLFIWMMVFVRAGGIMALMPVFSGQNVPVQIRVAVAAMLAWFVSGFVHLKTGVPADLPTLVFAATHELFIGLLMGFGMRLIFYAIDFAGQVMSTEVGLTMSSEIDPISRNSSSPVSIALFYFGSLLFLISGCHHAMFAAFLRSFDLAPIGGLVFHRNVAEILVGGTGKIFLVAVQMAAPLMAVNFVVNFTFAILGKAAPSINVYAESFSVRILAGIALLGLTVGLTAQIALSYLRESPELVLRLIP